MVHRIKGLKQVTLWLILALVVGAASAFALESPSLKVADRGTVEKPGGTYQAYYVTATIDPSRSSDYPQTMKLKRTRYYAGGSHETTIRDFNFVQGRWFGSDGVYGMTDEFPLTVNQQRVERVEYTIITGYDTVLTSAEVFPSGGGGGGGGGTDPPDPSDPGSGGGGDGSDPDPGSGGGGDGDGSDPDPGSGGGGGGSDPGTDGSCTACQILACPGWDDIIDKIGAKIPPPPDWEEVAEIFGDELVPRFERAMENALENTLGHPAPPPKIQEPSPPTFDGSVPDVPQATDSMPPAQSHDFSTVPDIQVNPDTTGGIDLRRADPTDNIPHDPADYMPMPGRENGGITPVTKPVETPVPSDGGVPQPPGEALPLPETSSGEVPTPGTSNDPPPRPELPMPQ